MASIRGIKNDIDYLVSEIISDCYVALYFNGEDKREAIVSIIEDAVTLRNDMFERVNNMPEKNNSRLVKKYYARIRLEMMEKVDGMFDKLSKSVNTK